MKLIQIEVTNACHLRCANCTRFVGHHKKPYFMDIDYVQKAIDSLAGFKGGVGLMGGEPALHPKFREICEMYQAKIPDRRKRELWTAGHKWDEYKDVIHATFDEDLIAYNDHSKPQEGWHQPLLVAIDEVIDDKELMWKFISNCWVQLRWSASINPKGAFFCEVAAAQDQMLDGPGGWPIEPGWWNKTPEQFMDQVKRYCPNCSACLPIPYIPSNHTSFDLMSPGNAERLKQAGTPKFQQGAYQIVDVQRIKEFIKGKTAEPGEDRGSFKDFPEWKPWNYRTQIWHAPGEGPMSSEEVRKIQTSMDKAAGC